MQKATDKDVKEIDKAVEEKDKEIMTVEKTVEGAHTKNRYCASFMRRRSKI